uniref:Serpentine Receptor, class T n=1 Tax=Caenorhabditis tropicalis TaxID=1561998 RepID=A0A1I7TXW2_9PELO
MIHLPYEVYKTTGWLAELGVSGMAQFMALGQCINVIGISILEMFYHRFQAVVIFRSKAYLTLPYYVLNIFRFLTFIHLLVFIWGRFDSRVLMLQEKTKQELFRKNPGLPSELGCFTVFIAVMEDAVFITTVSAWGVLVVLGLIVIIGSVAFIMQVLKKANTLSVQTKKMQRMLVFSLIAQVSIHGFMIALPISVQIYEWIFIIYDNNFGTLMLFFVAYHGFFSTCAMIVFTTQIRRKYLEFSRLFCRKDAAPIVLNNQVGASSTNFESAIT